MTFKKIIYRLNRRDLPLFNLFSSTIKILIVILIAFFAIITTKNIVAAETPAVNPLKTQQDAMFNGNNQESWLDSALSSNMMSLLVATGGKIPFEEDGSIKIQGYIPGGALGQTNNMISSLYYQPVSGIEYLAQMKDSFLGKPVYAQTGFEGLSPILPAWRVMRNTVYVLMTFFFIILGIMIMLRIKISPQATVTIQNTIPKIIITLILVTFSYAIAGLVIDFSKLFLGLILSLIYTAKGVSLNGELFPTTVFGGGGFPVTSWIGNIIQIIYEGVIEFFTQPNHFNNLLNQNFYGIYDLVNRAIPAHAGIALGEVAGQIFLGSLLGGLGSGLLGGLGKDLGVVVGGAAGDVVGLVGGALLVPLIMAVMTVIWMMKLYFGLLKCYIMVIFKIIIGPLQIGFGAFPTAKSGFTPWLTSIIANIIVFPATTAFIVALNYLTDVISGNKLWVPSQIKLDTISGALGGSIVSVGIGLAGVAMISKLPKLIPEAVFKIKPDAFGSAIGEAYKKIPGVGLARDAYGHVKDYAGKRFGENVYNRIGSRFSPPTIQEGSGEGNPAGPARAAGRRRREAVRGAVAAATGGSGENKGATTGGIRP